MRWLWRTCVALLMAVVVAGGVIVTQLRAHWPQIDGQLPLKGLSAGVDIRRDASDVTHIQASSALDAWRALGFVHAQERGWQLEFNRRLMHGELSEMLGPATLDIDKTMRTLGIMQVAARQFERLSPLSKAALQAYSEGIVAAHRSGAAGLSPEFRILGVKAGNGSDPAWSPQDSVAWALMMALDLGGNWGNEAARFALLQKMSTNELWQWMPPYPGERPASSVDLAQLYQQLQVYATPPATPQKQAAQTLSSPLLAWSQGWVNDLGVLEGKGSNNWVVPGSKTVSGKPLLANDPHLALSAPAIWYFAHLQAPESNGTPALDVIGATLPGLPFVVLGRTQGVAWGFTNTGPDVQDLYLEQLQSPQSNTYRTPDGWAQMALKPEVIHVKGQGDVHWTVRSTRHGPVISDAQPLYDGILNKDRYAMALRWAALDNDNATIDAGLQANFAQTVPELIQAYAKHHSPMQSVVMADTQGEVAFKAIGQVPLRAAANDVRGVAPVPGWLGVYDWAGWVPYAQTPSQTQARIETSGAYATANQRIIDQDYPHYLGSDWTTPERFDRIIQLLQTPDKIDTKTMSDIQHDVLSLGAKAVLPFALQARPTHVLGSQAMKLLADFDGRMTQDSAAAAILNVWAHELTRNLLEPRMGAALFKQLYGKRNFRSGLLQVLQHESALWCRQAGCERDISLAMDQALTRLQTQLGPDPSRWHWADMHPAISAHKPFDKVPVLGSFFSQSTPAAGDNFTVNVGQYWANDSKMPFANRHAASLRAIYDLANPDASMFIYQTGQSGDAFDPRSHDMASAWAGQGYRPLQMQPPGYRHTLRLRP